MAHHGERTEKLEVSDEDRLLLIKSPVVDSNQLGSHASSITPPAIPNMESLGFGDRIDHATPEFLRHEEATNVELFFDLFFAANLTVFSEVHEVTNQEQLISYVGYFTILWFTWALVGLFDVRFVTDSVFERLARACHQGVMIGFAVVAPNFKPNEQSKKTFQAMSVILVVSRLVLAIQYFSILCQVRKYKRTKLPLGIMVATHLIAAIIYLGATFGFRDYNTKVYYIWYIIGAFEIAISVVLSLVWEVISFQKTHLNQRMSLLTLIIIGEGIIVLSHNITTIVSNPGAWTSATVGVVTAGVATIYMVYQLYFDWMRTTKLAPVRQLLWVFFHYPVHLALTLFMEGASQFVLWWKVVEVISHFEDLLLRALGEPADTCPDPNRLSECVTKYLNESVQEVFQQYTPQYTLTIEDISTIFNEMSELDNEELLTEKFSTLGEEMYATVANSVLATFKIDAFAELESFDGVPSTEWEVEAFEENFSRYNLVVAYAFVSAGIVLILLNLLFVIQRTKQWTLASTIHIAVNFLLGLGLVLVSLLRLNVDRIFAFETSPYILPTICLVYTFVVVFNHLPGPSSRFYRPWLWRAVFAGRPRGGYAPSFNGDSNQYNLPNTAIPQAYEGGGLNTGNDVFVATTQVYAPVAYDGSGGYVDGGSGVPSAQGYTPVAYNNGGEYVGGDYSAPATQMYAPQTYEGAGTYAGTSHGAPATHAYGPVT